MRPISAIAADIYDAWPRPYFGAVPYLDAMLCISSANDNYGADSAKNIVAYFLSNASSFKGDAARALKAELKQAVKGAK
jgi:hypothetical protein